MSLNTREYEWADISVVFGGVDLTGIRAIKCKKKRETEEIYAKGREPKAIQSGNSSYEGEIEILQSDFHALEVAAGGNILDVNVDIIVAYGDPSNGDVMKIKKISGVRISDIEEAGKQGDKFMPITLPFKALGMKNVS
jgi:hypothetical protein